MFVLPIITVVKYVSITTTMYVILEVYILYIHTKNRLLTTLKFTGPVRLEKFEYLQRILQIIFLY